jgi:hypothetical protein
VKNYIELIPSFNSAVANRWACPLLLSGVVRVRLTRKLAEQIDGIDLSNYAVGDVMELSERKGRLLVAEGWGEEERRERGPSRVLTFSPEHHRETEQGEAVRGDRFRAS